MRTFALTLLTVTGLALSLPGVALAADAEVPMQRCGPGQVWDGYDCVRPAPRARAPGPEYEATEYQDEVEFAEPVYAAPRVYVAPPPVYIARPYYAPRAYYARPYYARPYVRYYAPRYGWGHRPWRRHAWR